MSSGKRLAGGQNTHDHVFVVAGRRDGRDAELNLSGLAEFEFDLAVLRFSALRDVEARHDFQARDDRAPIALGNLHVLETIAVDPEPHQGFALLSIRLDVNVRGVLPIGVGDDLVGQTDDGAVVFVEPASDAGFFHASAWASVTSSPRMSETFSSNLRPASAVARRLSPSSRTGRCPV